MSEQNEVEIDRNGADMKINLDNGPATTITFKVGPGVLGFDGELQVTHTFSKDSAEEDYIEKTSEAIKVSVNSTLMRVVEIHRAGQSLVDTMPKRYSSVIDNVSGANVPAPRVGAPVSASNATGLQAVAGGAPVGSGQMWKSYPNRFAGSDPYRTISLEFFSEEEMIHWGYKTLQEMNLDPKYFEVWDERKAGEKGQGISCAANIKLKKEYANLLVEQGMAGNKLTVFRAKFDTMTNLPKAVIDKDWNGLITFAKGGPFALNAPAAPAQAPAAPAPVAAPQAAPAPAPVEPGPGPDENPWGLV